MRALDLSETEAPHPGVSSGGVEVEGAVFVRASLTGNGSPSSGRQLGRGESGRCVCRICRKAPRHSSPQSLCWPNQAMAVPEEPKGIDELVKVCRICWKHLGIEQLGMANSSSTFPEPFNAGQLHGDMPAISTEYEHAFPQLQFQQKYQPSTAHAHLMLP